MKMKQAGLKLRYSYGADNAWNMVDVKEEYRVRVIGREVFDEPERKMCKLFSNRMLESVSRLISQLSAEQARKNADGGFAAGVMLDADQIKSLLVKDVRYLCLLESCKDGAIKGMVMVSSARSSAKDLLLENFYVCSEQRGKGYGRQMLDQLFYAIRRSNPGTRMCVTLRTSPRSKRLNRFYAGLGFRKDEILCDDDLLFLSKTLIGSSQHQPIDFGTIIGSFALKNDPTHKYFVYVDSHEENATPHFHVYDRDGMDRNQRRCVGFHTCVELESPHYCRHDLYYDDMPDEIAKALRLFMLRERTKEHCVGVGKTNYHVAIAEWNENNDSKPDAANQLDPDRPCPDYSHILLPYSLVPNSEDGPIVNRWGDVRIGKHYLGFGDDCNWGYSVVRILETLIRWKAGDIPFSVMAEQEGPSVFLIEHDEKLMLVYPYQGKVCGELMDMTTFATRFINDLSEFCDKREFIPCCTQGNGDKVINKIRCMINQYRGIRMSKWRRHRDWPQIY